jgi:hypothetical protein
MSAIDAGRCSSDGDLAGPGSTPGVSTLLTGPQGPTCSGGCEGQNAYAILAHRANARSVVGFDKRPMNRYRETGFSRIRAATYRALEVAQAFVAQVSPVERLDEEFFPTRRAGMNNIPIGHQPRQYGTIFSGPLSSHWQRGERSAVRTDPLTDTR